MDLIFAISIISLNLWKVKPLKRIPAAVSAFPLGLLFLQGWECHTEWWPTVDVLFTDIILLTGLMLFIRVELLYFILNNSKGSKVLQNTMKQEPTFVSQFLPIFYSGWKLLNVVSNSLSDSLVVAHMEEWLEFILSKEVYSQICSLSTNNCINFLSLCTHRFTITWSLCWLWPTNFRTFNFKDRRFS